VKDNGIGLSTSQQKQVFEKFFKDAIPRDGMESTGLGLSICKRIIDNHGGKIWVESPGAGKGSTFSFTLPTNSDQ
jgi:signal transduction histidine kinase